MKEVRIVFFAYHSFYDEFREAEELKAVARPEMSDWEQISDEEYQFLVKHWDILERQVSGEDQMWKPILLEKDPKPVRYRLANIKQWIQHEVEEQQKKAEQAAARAEARRQNRLLKQAKDEKALLAKLQQKYPDVT